MIQLSLANEYIMLYKNKKCNYFIIIEELFKKNTYIIYYYQTAVIFKMYYLWYRLKGLQ